MKFKDYITENPFQIFYAKVKDIPLGTTEEYKVPDDDDFLYPVPFSKACKNKIGKVLKLIKDKDNEDWYIDTSTTKPPLIYYHKSWLDFKFDNELDLDI